MSRNRTLLTSWVLAILAALGGGACADDRPQDPEARFRALREAHQAAFDAFVKANAEAKTPEEQAKVLDMPGRRPRDYAGGFMELARAHPGTPAAEEAMLWVATHVFQNAEAEEAKRVLARDFVKSPKLGPALGFQGHYADFFEGSEAFFRKILAENPHRDIQGLAAYWLARHLLYEAEGVKAAKQRPDFGKVGGVDYYAETYGKDWVERLRRLDAEALANEADTLFERVARFYGDVPHNDKRRGPSSLADAAGSYLREHRELAIGKPAPAFEGIDLDGKPFRLKDCLGKVVVVDFGSHFYCGQCRYAYPRLREMTKRRDGKKFVLVSVNAEPQKVLKDLKDAWAAEGNTWPCLFDGDWEGPIQKAWNIQKFPTFVVIDARGMIRFKDRGLDELDAAVEALIAEAEKP